MCGQQIEKQENCYPQVEHSNSKRVTVHGVVLAVSETSSRVWGGHAEKFLMSPGDSIVSLN